MLAEERKREEHGRPSLLEVFAKSIRDQLAEEQKHEPRHVTGSASLVIAREEVRDWLRSQHIHQPDVDVYANKLAQCGYDSLEKLASITPEELNTHISKIAHQRVLTSALPDLSRLLRCSRETCAWQWDDGLRGWGMGENGEGEPQAKAGGKDKGKRGDDNDSGEESEGSWVDYELDVIRRIETARLTRQRDLIVICGHNQRYRIDLTRMKQVNMRTQYKRDIRRVPPVVIRIHPPRAMRCPLSQCLMTDPVMLADGHSYERKAVEQWLQHHTTSPTTQLPLSNLKMTTNYSLRNAIEELQALSEPGQDE